MRKLLGFIFVCIAVVVFAGLGIGMFVNDFSPAKTLQRALGFVRAPGEWTDQLFEQFVQENIAGSTGSLAQTGMIDNQQNQNNQSGSLSSSVTGVNMTGAVWGRTGMINTLTWGQESVQSWDSDNAESATSDSLADQDPVTTTNQVYQERLEHFRAYIQGEEPSFRIPLNTSSQTPQTESTTWSSISESTSSTGINSTNLSWSIENNTDSTPSIQPRTIEAIQG